MPKKSKIYYVQFALNEEQAQAVKDFLHIESLSPACRSIVLKAIEHCINKKD